MKRNLTKSLLELCGAIFIIGTFCAAAGIKISELPVSEDPPSDNTYLEIADMDQVVKSRKLLLTNLTFRAGVSTQFIQNLYVTNFTQVGGATYISNVTQNFNFVTNVFTNVVQHLNLVTNYFTNVTQVFETNVFNIKNSTVNFTNTIVQINGTNVVTINATDSFLPYRAGSNFFGDSSLSQTGNVVVTAWNIAAFPSVGDTTVLDVRRAYQTNLVAGAFTIGAATNGVDGQQLVHVRKFMVASGGPHTLTIPSNWRTNVFSPVPPSLTNGTITYMYVKCDGPTSTLAGQTNCSVSWEYYR
jgi:hypothetical protein